MAKPLVVSIPHSLGKAEAKKRLESGLEQVQSMFSSKISSVEKSWADDRLTFKVAAIGQEVSGNLDVMEDSVRLEVLLPWALAIFAEKAKGLIEKQGTLMLEKK